MKAELRMPVVRTYIEHAYALVQGVFEVNCPRYNMDATGALLGEAKTMLETAYKHTGGDVQRLSGITPEEIKQAVIETEVKAKLEKCLEALSCARWLFMFIMDATLKNERDVIPPTCHLGFNICNEFLPDREDVERLYEEVCHGK